MSKMRKKVKQELVPQLRFPEFRDAGEWEIKALSEACRVTQGGTPDTTESTFWGGSVQWVTPAEMGKSNSKYIEKTVRSITEKGLLNCSSELLPIISVIISTRAPIGHLAINTEPMAINQGCRGLIPNSRFDAHFIFFSLEKSKKQLNDLGSGNIFKELSGKELKNFSLAFPIFEEQQKIAACLSSLDALIAAHTEKLQALKKHKKGLMQQLFPRIGETVPRLRFPEFRDAGEWEVKKLGDICDVRDGTHDSPQFYNTGKPLVTSKNLLSNGLLDLENVSYISQADYEKINKRSKVDIGDILFGIIGTIGNAVMVNLQGFAIKNVALIKQKTDLLNCYLVQFLNSQYIATRFKALNTGNIQKFIALGQIRNLSFPMPSVKEQQKIADCLASLDALITAQAEKLQALKKHKKGLMQQLFPNIVTEDTP